MVAPNKKNRGFTLIEVMVAMLLLFSAVAITNAIYSNAVNSTLKATQVLELNKYIPMILPRIREDVRFNTETRRGEGKVGPVSYQWSIELVERKPPPPRFDAEEREYLRYEEKFTLWEVEVQLMHNDRQTTFNFNEVSWVR